MFPLGRFLVGEQNDCVKVGSNICLNWKPAPGIQTVASVKIKIVDVEYFPLQFSSNPGKNKMSAGDPSPLKEKNSAN